MTRTLGLIAAGGLLALVLAVQALAAPPVHSSFVVSGEEDPIDCGNGVVLTETFTFTSRRTTFSDAAGNRTRFIDQGYYDGMITNEATGERFVDRNHYTLKVDFVAGTITINGASYRIRSEDGGPVLVKDLGHIVFSLDSLDTIEMSSKHPVLVAGFDATVEEAFCAALA
jgi:hypothetical protein